MKSNVLLVALLMPMCAVWGQGVYDEVLSAPESTATTKSITRAWKDNVQITCIEDIEYDPYYAGVILSSTAKFVYYDPTENEYRVAEFDNSLWPRVKDMEILEDTLYFCGYANAAASSTSPYYIGYIGYFCIPQLFDGTDNIHVLTFNQLNRYPITADDYIYINEPCKIEIFKVTNGIHVICTGGWSTSRGSLCSGGQFVADVVHEFSTGDWWYYIHRGDGTEIFSDVAVTNNNVMTDKIPPTATEGFNAAFKTAMQFVTIKYDTKEIISQP